MAQASDKEYLKINNSNELLNLCQGEKDHVNLFLKKKFYVEFECEFLKDFQNKYFEKNKM